MRENKYRARKKFHSAALFKITSRCNDLCKFCIERKFIEMKRENLSFKEIKNNFEYLKDNFNLDYVIITGGEPTLHPNFIKIIDYFYGQGTEFRIITNLLKFRNKDFFKKILPYFLEKNKTDRTVNRNKVIGSINDLPINNSAIGRIEGLKNVLKQKLPLMLITVIYKDNLEFLPELIQYLDNLFKRYKYNKPINIELRLIYIEGTLDSLLKISLPTDFKKIKKFVQKTIDIADSLGITLTLWNFPLCYLGEIPRLQGKTIQERRKRKLLKVNKDSQLRKIQVRDFEEYFKKSQACSSCLYNDYCSGIDGAYITKYHFPQLKPYDEN